MPSKSKAQHDAMEAAAHGKSTLGIPKSVGQDFAAADQGKKFSAKHMADAMKKRRATPKPPPEPDGDEGY